MTSRWSSPIPEINVWPVSGFVSVVNVGSSSANLASACPIRSWSAFVLGSIATEITGAGKSIDSKITKRSEERRVGKECRYGWVAEKLKKKKIYEDKHVRND